MKSDTSQDHHSLNLSTSSETQGRLENFDEIHVVGAGLAGSECAFQLAEMGWKVVLHEMRGIKSTPAHKTDSPAELVCSNSFGSMSEGAAPALLKEEAAALGSMILKEARTSSVPAGQALGVDREVFSQKVSAKLAAHPRIRIQREVVLNLKSLPRPAVIATGPLTDESLAQDLLNFVGKDFLFFFDAIAPIIDAESINRDIVFAQSRYDKGGADYLNCPMSKEQYESFTTALSAAEKVTPKDFEKIPFFESCMPIEELLRRGIETLRFGPMKPVGLRDPRTGNRPYAVVQLRQENAEATSYNMVGFQTRMTWGEQKRVLRMIPGLEQAEFLKLGSFHRNLYVHSPSCLNSDLSTKSDPWLFLAGQITGVEGYFESTCTGLMVAHFLNAKLKNEGITMPPRDSALGSLLFAITDPARKDHFQPTNINWGLFPALSPEETHELRKDKSLRKLRVLERARSSYRMWMNSLHRPSGSALIPEDLELPSNSIKPVSDEATSLL